MDTSPFYAAGIHVPVSLVEVTRKTLPMHSSGFGGKDQDVMKKRS